MTALRTMTWTGARALVPAFFAAVCYPILYECCWQPWSIAIGASGAVFLAVAWDGGREEEVFWASKGHLGANKDEAWAFLQKLLLRYVLVVACGALGYAWACQQPNWPATVRAGAVALGAGLAYLVTFLLFWHPAHHVRGRKLITLREATKKAHGQRPLLDPGVFWGGVRLATLYAHLHHYLIVGATRSGKTMLIRTLLQETVRQVGRGHGHRAIIYDPKTEFLSLLAGMGVDAPIYTLHPLDDPAHSIPERRIYRGVPWDIAKDCDSPAVALHIASVLAPEESEKNPFFDKAARDLVAGAILALMDRLKDQWELADLVLALTNESDLKALLSGCAHTRDRLVYFDGSDTSRDVLMTIRTKMMDFGPIAAAWKQSPKDVRLSLREWVKGEAILLLANDEKIRKPLDNLNRAMFAVASQLLLAQEDGCPGRTLVCLDEAKEASRLPGLESLLLRGAGKNVVVILGYQSQQGMRAAYGQLIADELTGQIGNKIFLRIEEAETAEWASKVIGEKEEWEWDRSAATSTSEKEQAPREHVTSRRVVLPSELMKLPPTTRETGLSGYGLSALVGEAWKFSLSGDFISRTLCPPDRSVRNFIERPTSDQNLPPWKAEERKALGLPEQPAQQGQQSDKPPAKGKAPERNGAEEEKGPRVQFYFDLDDNDESGGSRPEAV